jgi:uncharacterized protein (DUF2342 family)
MSSASSKDVLERAKAEEDLFEAAKALSQYLSVLLSVEYDIDSVDRIAKARRLEDFAEGVYNALRRRENLIQKIKEALTKAPDENTKNALMSALRSVEGFSVFKVDTLINQLRSGDSARLKLIASYIGSRAIAFTSTEYKVREFFDQIRGGGG